MATPKSRQTKDVKEFIRTKYAWPGGYPMALLMRDGECLCHQCAKDNAKLIIRSTREHARDDWCAEAPFINYEDTDLTCANCNARIESAYGEDDESTT